MSAKRWLLLTLTACSLTATGCQSTSMPRWKLWEQAAQTDRTRGLKDPVQTHLAYGRLQEQTGNFDAARESYEIVLDEDGKSIEAVLGLARLDVLGGRAKEAEKRFEQALQMAPQNVHALETIGQFYLAQGRFQDAQKVLQRAVDIDTSNKRLRFRLAVAQARAGDFRSAEQNFVQASGVAEADYNIGVILYENGNLILAEQRLQRALVAKPTLIQAQELLADIQSEIGASRNVAQVGSQAAGVPAGNQNIASASPGTLGAQAGNIAILPPLAPAPTGMPPVPNAAPSAIPTPIDIPIPAASTTAPSRVDVSRMNAAQLEQLENSMSPIEREQFRNQLRLGQLAYPQ